MLPGVEAARRRRIHQNGGLCSNLGGFGSGVGHGYTRRPTFCLYASGFEANLISSSSSSVQRNAINRVSQDEKLGQLAREAKGRLDERLRAQWKSEIQRNNSDISEERLSHINGRTMMIRELQTEVFGSKKKLVRWANKLVGWKASEQEECAVCLDHFKVGENLVNLPCAHRFHSKCLLPWLQTNAHCPCCRITIFSENLQLN